MNPLTYQLILHCITGLTVVSQLYIFYLINWESVKTMSNYKFFLNYFSLFDFLFTVVFGSILQADPSGRLFVTIPKGLVSWFSPQIQMIVGSFALHVAVNMVLSQDFCLLYRYSAIKEDRHLHDFLINKKGKALLILIGQVLSITISVGFYKILVQPEELYALPEFSQYFRQNEFALWGDLNSTVARVFLPIALILIVVSEGFCCLLIYFILTTLRKNALTFSRNSLKLHRQMTLLLATQLATPLILVIGPISFRLFNAVMENGSSSKISPDVTRIGFILLTFYGLSNSILTIVFVTPFRHHFINTFIIVWLRPIFSSLGLNHLAPRRKSMTWTSSTHQQTRRLTIVRSNLFE